LWAKRTDEVPLRGFGILNGGWDVGYQTDARTVKFLSEDATGTPFLEQALLRLSFLFPDKNYVQAVHTGKEQLPCHAAPG